MDKQTKAALTINSGLSLSFGCSLDDIVDFANQLPLGDTFVYQEVLHFPDQFLAKVQAPTKTWLANNLSHYENISATFKVLNDLLKDNPDKQKHLSVFLDCFNQDEPELEAFDF